MKINSSNKFGFKRSLAVASLVAVASTMAAPQAYAAIICSAANLGINVQTGNINGLYLNFVTNVNNTGGNGAGATVPGWDFNPYSSSGTATGSLSFFTSTTAANVNRVVGTGSTVDLLAAGATIGPSSTLATAGVVAGGAFRAGVTNGYVGIAFNNEATSTTNYGWASLTTTGPTTGFPTTLNQYCYQNDGTAITAGTLPVSLQGFSVE